MTIENIGVIITAIVAVIGLLLSIYNFHKDRKDKRPILRVTLKNGFLTHGPQISELRLIINVSNPGSQRVKVSSVELNWRKRSLVFIMGIDGTKDIPFMLDPGDDASFWLPITNAADSLREECSSSKTRIRACARSGVGNEYYSKWFKINLDEWASS